MNMKVIMEEVHGKTGIIIKSLEVGWTTMEVDMEARTVVIMIIMPNIMVTKGIVWEKAEVLIVQEMSLIKSWID